MLPYMQKKKSFSYELCVKCIVHNFYPRIVAHTLYQYVKTMT